MNRALTLAALLALAGCSSGPTDGRNASPLVDAPPLPTLADVAWDGAIEGCEGHLDGSESFGITQRDALVVARRGQTPICVDTLEAVSLELEAVQAIDAADELYAGFYAAIHLSQVEDWATPTSEDVDGGDVASGDPNPVPSSNAAPTEGDPNPVPSAEELAAQLSNPTPNSRPGETTTVTPRVQMQPDGAYVPEPTMVDIGETEVPGI
jgi:hypothetical protein